VALPVSILVLLLAKGYFEEAKKFNYYNTIFKEETISTGKIESAIMLKNGQHSNNDIVITSCMEYGIGIYGQDINPLSVLLVQSKTDCYNTDALTLALSSMLCAKTRIALLCTERSLKTLCNSTEKPMGPLLPAA
jgi:CRISPR/Cas system CMR-associated protein Cmr3 (group 5 of RAMP superfamily)